MIPAPLVASWLCHSTSRELFKQAIVLIDIQNSWQESFATNGRTEITPAEDSLIVSILSAGTFFGALTSAPVADWIGRRWGLFMSCAIVFNLGVILQTVSTSQPLFIAGRFFAGYGVGLISAMIPLYQSETSPKWIRGTVVGAYQLAITIVRHGCLQTRGFH